MSWNPLKNVFGRRPNPSVITEQSSRTHVAPAMREQAVAMGRDPIAHQFQARREEVHAAAKAIQRLHRGNSARQTQAKRAAAATSIQRLTRGHAARQQAVKRNNAASAIQRMQRGTSARKDVARMQSASRTISNFFQNTARQREREYKVHSAAYDMLESGHSYRSGTLSGVGSSLMQGMRGALYPVLAKDKFEVKMPFTGWSMGKVSNFTQTRYDDRKRSMGLASDEVAKQTLSNNKALSPQAQAEIEAARRRETAATAIQVTGAAVSTGIAVSTHGAGIGLSAATNFVATEASAGALAAAANKHGEASRLLDQSAEQQRQTAVTAQDHAHQKLTDGRSQLEAIAEERTRREAVGRFGEGFLALTTPIEPSGVAGKAAKIALTEAAKMTGGMAADHVMGIDAAKMKREEHLHKAQNFHSVLRAKPQP